MRPFTRSSLGKLDEFIPKEAPDSDLHRCLYELRGSVYAHTDKDTDRQFFFSLGYDDVAEDDWVPFAHTYTPLPDEFLEDVVSLCYRLKDDLMREARRTWIALGRPHQT